MRIRIAIYSIVSLLSVYSYSQDDCLCFETDYKSDTLAAIQNAKTLFEELNSLSDKDFDYIHTYTYDDGCHEPDQYTEITYYLDGKIAIQKTNVIGGGQGNVQTNSESISYFQNGVETFQFFTEQSDSYRTDAKPQDSYKRELRFYFDECGQRVRLLYKKVTLEENIVNREYDKLLNKKPNQDITDQNKPIIRVHNPYLTDHRDCDCDGIDIKTDTSKTIKNIKEFFVKIESLSDDEYDFIFSEEYDDGCHEPNQIFNKVYFLDGKIVKKIEAVIGCGEGGVRESFSKSSYYENDKEIFSFYTQKNDCSYNLNSKPEDDYQTETRSYYDECGRMIRKLQKSVTKADLKKGESYEKALSRTPNLDVTIIKVR